MHILYNITMCDGSNELWGFCSKNTKNDYWQWWRKKRRHARPAEKLITDVTKESVEDNANGPEKYFSHFLSLG